MNVETDFCEVETEEIYLYGIGADLVIDLCVLDAGVDSLETLCGNFTTESTESTESTE
jgi:hypothetical protein